MMKQTLKSKLIKAIDALERSTNINKTGIGEYVCQFCHARGLILKHLDNCPVGNLWHIVNEDI